MQQNLSWISRHFRFKWTHLGFFPLSTNFVTSPHHIICKKKFPLSLKYNFRSRLGPKPEHVHTVKKLKRSALILFSCRYGNYLAVFCRCLEILNYYYTRSAFFFQMIQASGRLLVAVWKNIWLNFKREREELSDELLETENTAKDLKRSHRHYVAKVHLKTALMQQSLKVEFFFLF